MKKITFLLLLSASAMLHSQQIAPDAYWIYFKDKAGSTYRIDRPEDFLSIASIERRAWQGLEIDERDLPLTQAYIDEISSMGIVLRHRSRWLNGAVMTNITKAQYLEVLALPFVDSIPWEPSPDKTYLPPKPDGQRFSDRLELPPDYDYGLAREQVLMLETDRLHNLGFTAAGVGIAVLDAGFRNVDSLPAFTSMIEEGRLKGGRNFVRKRALFRESSTHGMYVLSIIGADWDGNLVGTAPDAHFFLCMTENPDQESRLEEVAWIEAAEYIDSLGYDVVNTSLGYNLFDDPIYDYSYSNMDGQSTLISRAASLLSSRGIIGCNSAGNSGEKPWLHITAPADAFDVLSVGACDSLEQTTGFSSKGPSFDGRIKPDLTAMGVATAIQAVSGGLVRGNGTSFSSPVLAGSVASLWQAFPETPATTLMQQIRMSADRSGNPDNRYGYGVPDFLAAYYKLTGFKHISQPPGLELYPNPARRRLSILFDAAESPCRVLFSDLSGRIAAEVFAQLPGQLNLPSELETGMYILLVETPVGRLKQKLFIIK